MKFDKGLIRYIKNLRPDTIFFKNMMIYTVLIMIVVLSFIGFFYIESKSILDNEIKTSAMNSIKRTYEFTETTISAAENVCSSIIHSQDANFFMYSSSKTFNNNALIERLRFYIRSFSNVYDYFHSIYLYSEKEGKVIVSNDSSYYNLNDMNDRDWLQYYNNCTDSKTIFVLRKLNGKYPALLTIIKPYYVTKNNKGGCCVVNINIEDEQKLFGKDNILTERYGYLTALDGEIYYSTNSNIVGENMKNVITDDYMNIVDNDTYYNYSRKNNNIVLSMKSSTKAFYYVSVIPMEYYNLSVNEVVNKSIILGICYFIVAAIVILFISRFSYKPINDIMNFIESDESKNSDSKSRMDEVKYIMEYIAKISIEKKEIDSKVNNYIVALKQSHNVALQSQINPHFLCNTLELINWKAIKLHNGKNEVSEMISDLGDIYEYLLRVNDYWITVEKEAEHTKLYEKILKLRYEDKFIINWNIDNCILDYYMIKLSLQPIIENAVYHGIKEKDGQGIIDIKGYKNDNCIIFEISDNGVGMSEEKLNEVKKNLNNTFFMNDKHIGLSNVNQRIKVVFGDEYGIDIESEAGKGTKVKLTFPVHLI